MERSKFSVMENSNMTWTMGIPTGQWQHHPDSAAPHTCSTQRQSFSFPTFQGRPCLYFSIIHSKNTFPTHLSKGGNTAAVHLESSHRAENNQRLLARGRWGQTMEEMGKGEGVRKRVVLLFHVSTAVWQHLCRPWERELTDEQLQLLLHTCTVRHNCLLAAFVKTLPKGTRD